MRIALILACGLSLSGCAITASQERAQIDAAHDARCQSWGADPQSDAYIRCRSQLEHSEDQRRAAIAGAFLATRPQSYMLPTPQAPARPSGPTNCTSQVVGNQVYTNCY